MAAKVKLDAQQHLISAVTLFRSAKAEILRSFSVEVEDGQNDILITNLPYCIDAESVQVQGLGNATLFDVSTNKAGQPGGGFLFGQHPTRVSDALRELQNKKTELEGERQVLNLQAQMLVQYSSTLTAEHINPVKMLDFMDDFYDKGQSNLEGIARITRQIEEIDEAIEREKKEATSIDYSKLLGAKVTIVLLAKSPGTIKFNVSYMVSNASWRPVYDLHAVTANGTLNPAVMLQYRAAIQQSTGEDWRNVKLTLSTSFGDWEAAIPAMRELKLEMNQQRYLAGKKQYPNGFDRFRGGLGYGNVDAALYHPSGFGFGAGKDAQSKQSNFGPKFASNTVQGFGGFGASNTNTTGGSLFGAPPQPGQSALSNVTGPSIFSNVAPQLFGSAQSQTQSTATGFASASAPPIAAPLAPATETSAPGDEFVVVPPGEEGENSNEREQAIQQVSESTAIATETSIAASYEVEGKSTIPSDNAPHRVALIALSLEAQARFIAVPRARERVYLDCVVKNASTHHFLPGKITIYMDDRHVTKADLPYVAPEDKFVCCLGPDRSIRIRYSHEATFQEQNRSKYAAQEETYTHSVKITLTNKRSTPLLSVVLRDMLPTTDNPRIKVVLKSPMVLTECSENEAKEVKEGVMIRWRKMPDGSSGEKHGWLEWVCSDVPVGGEVEVVLQCDITSPTDVVVFDPVSLALFKAQAFKF